MLSDPKERKWYDNHRSAILRGSKPPNEQNDDTTGPEFDIDELYKFFSPTCYDEMDESLNGFYTVYQTCFKDIYDKELASDDGLNLKLAPPFGSSSTVDSDVLAFYSFWTNFVTVLSFAWVDKHNPNDATSRDVSDQCHIII